jgi:hypothetical protein
MARKHEARKAEAVVSKKAPLPLKGEIRKFSKTVLDCYDEAYVTRHAIKRMNERDILWREVEHVLSNPSYTKGLDTEPGQERWARRRSASHCVDVIFQRLEKSLRIITVILVERC